MGLFDFIKPYVTAKKFENRASKQKQLVGRFLNLLDQVGDNDEKKQVEFFFYSKSYSDGELLKADLEKLDYEVYGVKRSLEDKFSITGVTPPISLREEEFKKWIQQMNEVGFINNCLFDGWGMLSSME